MFVSSVFLRVTDRERGDSLSALIYHLLFQQCSRLFIYFSSYLISCALGLISNRHFDTDL